MKSLEENLMYKHRFVLSGLHSGIAESYCKLVLNSTLKLSYAEFGNTDDWDLTIDAVQFSLNTRVMVNGYIPFVLMYRRSSFYKNENPGRVVIDESTKSLYLKERSVLLRH